MKRRRLFQNIAIMIGFILFIQYTNAKNLEAREETTILVAEEENNINSIQTDEVFLSPIDKSREALNELIKIRKGEERWKNWFKMSPCQSGYLEGVCTFALDCHRIGGYAENICSMGFFNFGVCCTTRSSLSVVNANKDLKSAEDCGLQKIFQENLTSRVVNGKEGYYGQFPWTASMRLQFPLDKNVFFSQHYCGSVLLSHQWVATTAHCVFSEDDGFNYTILRFGETKEEFELKDEVYPYVERSILKAFVHPNFKRKTFHSDIALLKLDKPVDFLPNIQPICLPGNSDSLAGQIGVVSGWGRTKEDDDELPDTILTAALPIMTNEECEEIYLKGNYSENIANAQNVYLCAGYEDGFKDACTGDSGGPLQVQGKDGRVFLGGIISWGYGCSRKYKPGVYTRISEFVPWILDIMKNN